MTGALASKLSPLALTELGRCRVSQSDDGMDGTVVLIGPDEPEFWPLFKQSAEYNDGLADPIDRWSHRVLTALAAELGGDALFPFGGPPYQPFYSWAVRSGRFWPSPIGFLVHDERGLFVSFRGAMLFSKEPADTPRKNRPCDTCTGRPCLSACPVNAFADGYDVDACKAHLRRPEGNDCMSLGCRARAACPIGQGTRIPDQAQHHMKAFL